MNDSRSRREFSAAAKPPVSFGCESRHAEPSTPGATSQTGLNPMQAGMQIAIPEIDGATEPFVYGGLPASGVEPIALRRALRQICAAG